MDGRTRSAHPSSASAELGAREDVGQHALPRRRRSSTAPPSRSSKELQMEYAVELNRLIELQMDGASVRSVSAPQSVDEFRQDGGAGIACRHRQRTSLLGSLCGMNDQDWRDARSHNVLRRRPEQSARQTSAAVGRHDDDICAMFTSTRNDRVSGMIRHVRLDVNCGALADAACENAEVIIQLGENAFHRLPSCLGVFSCEARDDHRQDAVPRHRRGHRPTTATSSSRRARRRVRDSD
jgi:hypothetical protein